MNVNQINIVQNFNKIPFKANEAVTAAKAPATSPSSSPIKDSLEVANKVEPPVISNDDIAWHKITDAQIDQINKAGMLPPNARFDRLYSTGARGGMLISPFYEIVVHVPYLPTINKQTRVLPKGFVVIRSHPKSQLRGLIGAVPIQKK